MTTPTDKFSTASADQSAEAPFVMELIIKNIRTHYRGVNGCKRHKRDVMVSFMHEGDESVHDIFLTQEQAEGLLKDLTATLAHNADDTPNDQAQAQPPTATPERKGDNQ